MNDYTAFKSAAPSSEKLSALSSLVSHMHDAETEVAAAEQALKDKRDVLRGIAETQIPELMASVGMAEFTTASGFKVKIKRTYTASPLVDHREQCWDWLEEHGHGGLVKRSVEVGFGMGQGDDAAQLVKDLEGKFNNVRSGRKVESASLRAWVKKRIEAGEPVPMDLFNARVFDKAVIKSVVE